MDGENYKMVKANYETLVLFSMEGPSLGPNNGCKSTKLVYIDLVTESICMQIEN